MARWFVGTSTVLAVITGAVLLATETNTPLPQPPRMLTDASQNTLTATVQANPLNVRQVTDGSTTVNLSTAGVIGTLPQNTTVQVTCEFTGTSSPDAGDQWYQITGTDVPTASSEAHAVASAAYLAVTGGTSVPTCDSTQDTTSGNGTAPGENGSLSFGSNSAATTRGDTTTVGTISCPWTINIDSVDNSTKRDYITIPVRCTAPVDSITITVAYLDMDGNTLRTEAASSYAFTASADRSTSSANDNEKWIMACVQATKGASTHKTCERVALYTNINRAAQLINLNSGLCLGIAGGSGGIGAAVVQFTCRSHKDQGWTLPWKVGESLPNPAGTEGFIKNYGATNRCLGTLNGNTDDLTKVISRACNAGNLDEIWLPVSAAPWGYPGGYVLENSKTGLRSCLGVPLGSPFGSVQLVIYPCNGQPDQVQYHLAWRVFAGQRSGVVVVDRLFVLVCVLLRGWVGVGV